LKEQQISGTDAAVTRLDAMQIDFQASTGEAGESPAFYESVSWPGVEPLVLRLQSGAGGGDEKAAKWFDPRAR
jgi:hypothetical protein